MAQPRLSVGVALPAPQNAHRSAEAVPDLQNLLDKQQTIAQSTAAIHSAVGTYRGNRAKAAAEELEKQQAAHEGSLKERNDGSYEHYLSLSDAQRQQEMLKKPANTCLKNMV